MAHEQKIFEHTYENGLILVAQPMPWLASAAFSIAVPAGYRYEPADQGGTANFVCEMVQRGSGSRDSRQFIESLEMLGVNFNSSASCYGTSYGGASQSAQLLEAISIFADMLLRPHFPESQLEDGRLVCLQEVYSLEDDLYQRAMMELRKRFYGDPDGRHSEGTVESLASIDMDALKNFYQQNYRPNGAVIACAGNLDWPRLQAHVGQLFQDWKTHPETEIQHTPPVHGMHHIAHESEQTHIALAYPGLAYSHEDYFKFRGAVGVLSGGMSSRLFSEIREKRGLCYTVQASCHSLKERGSVFCYSGTSTGRAQETLDVLIEQLQELGSNGIREDELRRLKTQLRGGLVMQQESCRSRVRSIIGDVTHLGRVRSLDEINENYNGLTVDSVNEFLQANPPADFEVVTLGAEPLKFQTKQEQS